MKQLQLLCIIYATTFLYHAHAADTVRQLRLTSIIVDGMRHDVYVGDIDPEKSVDPKVELMIQCILANRDFLDPQLIKMPLYVSSDDFFYPASCLHANGNIRTNGKEGGFIALQELCDETGKRDMIVLSPCLHEMIRLHTSFHVITPNTYGINVHPFIVFQLLKAIGHAEERKDVITKDKALLTHYAHTFALEKMTLPELENFERSRCVSEDKELSDLISAVKNKKIEYKKYQAATRAQLLLQLLKD